LTDKKHKEKHPWCTFDRKIKVSITTIDNFCRAKNIQEIHFLWMDVQGAEGLVLEGAQNMLKNIHFIYAECIDAEYYEGEWSFNKLSQYLFDRGWSLLERYPEDALFKNNNIG